MIDFFESGWSYTFFGVILLLIYESFTFFLVSNAERPSDTLLGELSSKKSFYTLLFLTGAFLLFVILPRLFVSCFSFSFFVKKSSSSSTLSTFFYAPKPPKESLSLNGFWPVAAGTFLLESWLNYLKKSSLLLRDSFILSAFSVNAVFVWTTFSGSVAFKAGDVLGFFIYTFFYTFTSFFVSTIFSIFY